jgi:hypothetical protein
VKECPNCATEIADRHPVCPICRYEFPRRPVLPWKPVAVLVLAAILVPLLVGVSRLLAR